MAMQDPTRFYSRYQEQNPMDYVDPLGGRPLNSMMGGDAFSQQLIEDMLMGTGQQYTPGGLDAGPMFPGPTPQMNPQDLIAMLLSGRR